VELFFSGLIGNVQIENVIPFILKMDVLQIFGKESLVQMSSSIVGSGVGQGPSNGVGSSMQSLNASNGGGGCNNGTVSPLDVDDSAGMDEDFDGDDGNGADPDEDAERNISP